MVYTKPLPTWDCCKDTIVQKSAFYMDGRCGAEEVNSPKYTKKVHVFGLFSVDVARVVCYDNNDLILCLVREAKARDYGRKKQ